jgi:hypothetical protein
LSRRRRGKERERPPTIVHRSPSARVAEAAVPVEAAVLPEPPVVPSEPAAPPRPFPAPVEERTAPPPPPAPSPPEAPTAAPVSADATRPPGCDPYHFWEVAYERGELGADGVWRFPHRCRNCGLELLASDVSAATAQADARG